MTAPSRNYGLILKVLLISHGYLFFYQKNNMSGFILGACFILLLFPKPTKAIDETFEHLLKQIGRALLSLFLFLFYILIILPLSLFKAISVDAKTSFVIMNREKINFRRPW